MKNRIRGIPLVLSLLVVLLMAACGAAKNAASEQAASTQSAVQNTQLEAQAAAAHDVQHHAQEQMQAEQTTTRQEYAESVPEESATATIPTSSLLNLPDGAKFSAQNGRASVEAERQGDEIIVRGKCDSIARRCTYFENSVFRQRILVDSLTARLDEMQAYRARADSLLSAATVAYHAEHTERSPSARGRWFLFGLLAGGAASALLTKTSPLKTIVSLIKRIV